MSDRQPYKSDLTDERWALIESVIASWKARHPSVSGHQGTWEIREIVNALLYQSRTGCQWDYLPHDLPPVGAVKWSFYKWRDDGTGQTTMLHRRTVLDYEHRAASAESRVYWAISDRMARMLTANSTPTWHGAGAAS